MDQTQNSTNSSSPSAGKFPILNRGKRIAYIQAGWHQEIVKQAQYAFCDECEKLGISMTHIDFFEVPGSLEIPLQAKLLAKTGEYAVIVAAGLIVDGGIYRHDFVSSTVLDAMMQVQLEQEVPVLSLVLTPLHFEEGEASDNFFFDHFKIKGVEAANACARTLLNIEQFDRVKTTQAA
jgi:6,7-dimethyl-8-ribityllumazine synthase